MNNWFYSGSSVTGQSHLVTSIPCQDKFSIETTGNGDWFAVAVCDGAGSAEFAEIGATITSTYFCKKLIGLAAELNERPPGEWINDFVINCITEVRNELRLEAGSDNIRKYHCTLVAALIGKSGGFSIHIGDGALFGGNFEKNNNGSHIELNKNFIKSNPENGEYANETFFITEGNWIKHLRILPLPPLDWMVVCTDGGASLLLDNDNEVKPNFLAPFVEAQINDKFQNKNYITEILSDPKANKLTADDKTIVLAIRNNLVTLPIKCIFTKAEASLTPEKFTIAIDSESIKKSINDFKREESNSFEDDENLLASRKKNNPSKSRKRTKKLIFLYSFSAFIFVALLIAFIKWHDPIINKIKSILNEEHSKVVIPITTNSKATSEVGTTNSPLDTSSVLPNNTNPTRNSDEITDR
jgi:hypothetical protein